MMAAKAARSNSQSYSDIKYIEACACAWALLCAINLDLPAYQRLIFAYLHKVILPSAANIKT